MTDTDRYDRRVFTLNKLFIRCVLALEGLLLAFTEWF